MIQGFDFDLIFLITFRRIECGSILAVIYMYNIYAYVYI